VQASGALCIWAWTLVTSLLVFFAASRALGGGISYPHDEQLIGLDFTCFGGSAHPDLDPEVTKRGCSKPSRDQSQTVTKRSGKPRHTLGSYRPN
jgi:hypothetical protein